MMRAVPRLVLILCVAIVSGCEKSPYSELVGQCVCVESNSNEERGGFLDKSDDCGILESTDSETVRLRHFTPAHPSGELRIFGTRSIESVKEEQEIRGAEHYYKLAGCARE